MGELTPFTPSEVMEEATTIVAGGKVKQKALNLIVAEKIPLESIDIIFRYKCGGSLYVSTAD